MKGMHFSHVTKTNGGKFPVLWLLFHLLPKEIERTRWWFVNGANNVEQATYPNQERPLPCLSTPAGTSNDEELAPLDRKRGNGGIQRNVPQNRDLSSILEFVRFLQIGDDHNIFIRCRWFCYRIVRLAVWCWILYDRDPWRLTILRRRHLSTSSTVLHFSSRLIHGRNIIISSMEWVNEMNSSVCE